jgi:crossover junction endodeoxyribonuclease RusA
VSAALPFDLIVEGIPRSVNAATRSLNRWKLSVGETGAYHWGTNEVLDCPLSVFICYFHTGQTSIDIDNIIKPIVDSLKGVIFRDDNLVEQDTCRKTRQEEGLLIDNIPELLSPHFGVTPDFIYIRLGNGPIHREIPL